MSVELDSDKICTSTMDESTTADKSLLVSSSETSNPVIPCSQPVVKLIKLPASTIASSCDNNVNNSNSQVNTNQINSNQEQIVEKAKQVDF